MKTQPTTLQPCALPCTLRETLTAVLLPVLLLILNIHSGQAGSATWNLNPTSDDWNTAANWTPATVPNGATNTATFDVSNITDVSVSAGITLKQIVYTPVANAFSVDTHLNGIIISGPGIINNSANVQQFVLPVDSGGGWGTIQFFNTATAGNGTSFIVAGSINALSGGLVQFWNDSTAGEGSFSLEGGGSGASTTGGRVFFNDNSTAGNATFVSKSGGDGNFGGTFTNVIFNNTSSAGNATIIAMPATNANTFFGAALFQDTARAENATLIAMGSPRVEGGRIHFFGSSTGDNATVKLYGTGNMQFHVNTAASLTIGSLEGDGIVIAGSKTLIVGTNNHDTTFSGSMPTGALSKTGTGTFVLSGAQNTYAGGTTIDQGTLFTNNTAASATGTGPVQVNRGTFGGNGIVSGPVTIGNGTARAVLSPGVDGIGLLTLQSSLTFKANTRYLWDVNAATLKADEVMAQGVTIESGAEFRVSGHGASLPLGQVFLVISNSSASPFSGNFSNLADGSTIRVGSNAFQANYEGGDGNDLTLTVMP